MPAEPSRTIDELTTPALTKSHVERRVRDWLRRLDALYAQVREALGDAYEYRVERDHFMHEDLMRKFNVGATRVPWLTIVRKEDRRTIGHLYPRGLWIIGANGRVDFDTPEGLYVVVDVAENFAEANWHFASVSRRQNLKRLSDAAIRSFFPR
jgi:hypothetical protein